MRDFIGVNVKPQLDYSRIPRIGQARAFHLWADDQGNLVNGTYCPLDVANEPNKIRWNPSKQFNRYIRFDDFYRVLPRKTIAVLHGSSPHQYNNGGELFAKPACEAFRGSNWGAQSQPASWLSNARRASLFAARYAGAPAGGFPAGFSTIAGNYVESPDNTGLGLNIVKYIEIFNEMDASWNDGVSTSITGAAMENDPNSETKYYFRPDQYGAMLSAAYDGNQNSSEFEIKNSNGQVVGHWGIHNLSSGAQVVLGGTADFRYDYLYLLKKYWDEHRNGSYPFDVVNYHFYSTSGQPNFLSSDWEKIYHGRGIFGGGKAIFPEDPKINLRGRIEKLLEDRANPPAGSSGLPNLGPLFPEKPSWITEFGYDTQGSSNLQIDPVGALDAQTMQGQWITRYIMEASAANHGNSVQKVFIYELNDDPALSGGQYGSSGLINGSNQPKKAWYHLMTLKSVLDWTSFNKTNEDKNILFEDFDSGSIMSPDDPRMYLYGSEARPNYAIWLPHGQDLRKHGAILIRKTGINKPDIQAIEVVDFDEDGKRTHIDPSLISSYTTAFGEYWKITGIRLGDTQIELNETPLYLRVNQSRSGSDRVVLPVKDLAANCSGCHDIKLTWTKQETNYAYYNIYSQIIDCSNPPLSPAFDPDNCTLVGEKVPGFSSEAVVSNLQEGACYLFWVVPFASNANGLGVQGIVPLTTFSPTDMSSPVAGMHYIKFSLSDECSPCVAQFTSTQINLISEPAPNGFSSFERQQFMNMLIPVSGEQICDELASAPPPQFNNGNPNEPTDHYGLVLGGGKKVVFTIDLQGTKYIDAISFFYLSGNGRVRFEILEDCCNLYTVAATIDVHDGATLPHQWYRIFNTPINFRRVEKIRVTIEGLFETGLTIQRMFFCLRPAEDECPGTVMREKVLSPVENLAVQDLDAYSAILRWDASRQVEQTTELEPATAYTLRYGIALNTQGEIVQPVELKYRTQSWVNEHVFGLSQLVPNTTYFVDIVPDIEVYPCTRSVSAARVSFTTPGESKDRQQTEAKQPAASDFLLSPNPASELLNVSNLDTRFHVYRICRADGVPILEGVVPANSSSMSIPLGKLSSGMYVINFLGESIRPVAKAFVIDKP